MGKTSGQVCKVEWCGVNKIEGYGMCKRHYTQYKKRGNVFKTYLDRKPEYIEDYKVYRIGDKEILFDADFELPGVPILHKKTGYARINYTEAHKLVLKVKSNQQVDHINRNKLDNRLKNLRPCTHQENNFNRSRVNHNKSGYIGVTRSQSGKWSAYIKHNQRQVHIGLYNDIMDAARARDKKAKELFGDYANLNLKAGSL